MKTSNRERKLARMNMIFRTEIPIKMEAWVGIEPVFVASFWSFTYFFTYNFTGGGSQNSGHFQQFQRRLPIMTVNVCRLLFGVSGHAFNRVFRDAVFTRTSDKGRSGAVETGFSLG